MLAAFHRGLAEIGFAEAKNLTIKYRWAEGRYERLPALAAELVDSNPVVLAATGGSSAALAAKAATSTIPIVFTVGGDPVKLGLVESLSRPGRNVTGVTLFITEVGAKRLELLRELAPKTSVLGVIVNPSYPPAVDEARDVQGYAHALGFQVHLLNIAREADIEQASATIAALQITALLVANDLFLIGLRDRLVRVAAEQSIPAVYITREFVEAGGLMSYGADVRDGYRRTGAYVGEILKGAKPADLPVLQPTKLELLLNLRTARMLGITVPLTLQAQADEVIE
ncbi:MAG TPA: ABC transporter substrate-binding protein [Beijerinckiaceae bacterium]|nr:ABC transporter substrate-binding protein [Beijerinckiaceae bacterium]